MDAIVRRIPAFITQHGRQVLLDEDKTTGKAFNWIVDPACPHLLTIKGPRFTVELNRKGVTAGLTESWTEAERNVTIRPYQATEVLWLVVDIYVDGLPVTQISAQLENVAAFLSMAEDLLALSHTDVFEALVPRPARGGDRETEWMPNWLRRDGGAA